MNPDLAPFQGRWRILELEVGGQKMPQGLFSKAEVAVDGDRFISSGMGANYAGTMTAVPAAGDRYKVSIAFGAGPESGNVNHALCEVDGDTWRMCIDMKGGPAPPDFTTSPADGYALQVLERKPD